MQSGLGPFFLAICAYTDGTQHKIYNKVTFPTMGIGLVLNGIFGGLNGLLWSLIGLFIGLAIQWIPMMLGVAKAGDVKLLGGVGALKRLGVLHVRIFVWRRRLRGDFAAVAFAPQRVAKRGTEHQKLFRHRDDDAQRARRAAPDGHQKVRAVGRRTFRRILHRARPRTRLWRAVLVRAE